jgi:hypothetical protein
MPQVFSLRGAPARRSVGHGVSSERVGSWSTIGTPKGTDENTRHLCSNATLGIRDRLDAGNSADAGNPPERRR